MLEEIVSCIHSAGSHFLLFFKRMWAGLACVILCQLVFTVAL